MMSLGLDLFHENRMILIQSYAVMTAVGDRKTDNLQDAPGIADISSKEESGRLEEGSSKEQLGAVEVGEAPDMPGELLITEDSFELELQDIVYRFYMKMHPAHCLIVSLGALTDDGFKILYRLVWTLEGEVLDDTLVTYPPLLLEDKLQ